MSYIRTASPSFEALGPNPINKQDVRPAKNETGSETKLLDHRGQGIDSLLGLVPTQKSSKNGEGIELFRPTGMAFGEVRATISAPRTVVSTLA